MNSPLYSPHARYRPPGERATQLITVLHLIMLLICLWDMQSHSETEKSAPHAMNLSLDAIDTTCLSSWVDHSENEDFEKSKQMILPMFATNSCWPSDGQANGTTSSVLVEPFLPESNKILPLWVL